MWETSQLGSEDLLWAAMTLHGGIAGQREAVCGALSASAVYLGLRHRVPMQDKEHIEGAKELARQNSRRVVQYFEQKYGVIICRDLLGIDVSDTEALERFRASGQWQIRCDDIIQFAINTLYNMENQ